MANHKATKKDVRQSAKRNERNRYYGKTTRNAIRDIKLIDDKKAASESRCCFSNFTLKPCVKSFFIDTTPLSIFNKNRTFAFIFN